MPQQESRTGLRGSSPARALRVLGPGLITSASDDDPSGIGTYSQVGSQFGFGLLWTALFTYPLMAAVQELCARIALETGLGLGAALRRRFPAWLVGVCIMALVVANTFNLGADLGAVAAGGSLLTNNLVPAGLLVAPVAALILVLELFASYRTVFNVLKWLTLSLFAYVFAGLLIRPPAGAVLQATFLPHFEGTASFVMALVAVLGTTISPYLFFWQASSEVDELRAAGKLTQTRRRGAGRAVLTSARTDVLVGMAFAQVVMYFIMLASGAVLHAHGKTNVQTAAQAAQALAPLAGQFAAVLFSLGLIGTGLLAIPILSASCAYAVKEFFGLPGQLGDRPRYRPTFAALLAGATLAGLAMNIVHVDPIRALFLAAVINGVVAPPLLILITLLGSDRRLMKRRVSGPWSRSLTWLAATVMILAVLVMFASMLTSGRGS